MRATILLASLVAPAAAQWDTKCANATGGPWSAWNESRCPSDSQTCCASGFSPSSVGCCPFKNAVCCPGSQFACCPEGNVCSLVEGSGYDARWNCTAPTGAVSINAATCKGGPPLPMSATKKNVVWIGDSLSLGMIPHVAASLSDIALVQHAPWGMDGGAEETTYGLRCLDNYLHSPSGMPLQLDLVLFNFGMHDGPMFNNTFPGQNAPPDSYREELAEIADRLLAYTKPWGAKLVFTTTTPFICTAQQDGCVQTLNNWAKDIMAQRAIPVIDSYTPTIAKCGVAPQKSCFGANSCALASACFPRRGSCSQLTLSFTHLPFPAPLVQAGARTAGMRGTPGLLEA